MSLGTSLNSLKDSEQLATFLLDLLSTGDLPNWCEDSGVAVCFWIEQLVGEKNLEHAVSLVTLVINYTHLESQSNYPSFIQVYMTLNKYAEELSNTYSDTKWTFIAFWQAVSDIHMILLKLCPELLGKHMVTLGEMLLATVCNLSAPFFLRQVRVKALSCLMETCPSPDFNDTHLDYIPNLVLALFGAGDYDFQTSLVEVIMRMSSLSERTKHEIEWFSAMEEKDRKLFLAISDFEPECRLFLNSFNASMAKERSVFSFAAILARIGNFKLSKPNVDSYEHLWVDFNLGSRTVSVLFQHDDVEDCNKEHQFERHWETIMVYDYEVEKANLDHSCGKHTLMLHLRKHPEQFFVSTLSEQVRKKLSFMFVLQFPAGDVLPMICSTLFEEALEVTENKFMERPKISSAAYKVKITGDGPNNCNGEAGTFTIKRKPSISKSKVLTKDHDRDHSTETRDQDLTEIDSDNFIPSSNPISDNCSLVSHTYLKSVASTPSVGVHQPDDQNETSIAKDLAQPVESAKLDNELAESESIILSGKRKSAASPYPMTQGNSNDIDVDIISPFVASDNFDELSMRAYKSQNPNDFESDVPWDILSSQKLSQPNVKNQMSSTLDEGKSPEKNRSPCEMINLPPETVDDKPIEDHEKPGSIPENDMSPQLIMSFSKNSPQKYIADSSTEEQTKDDSISRDSPNNCILLENENSQKHSKKSHSPGKQVCHFSGAKSPHCEEGSRISLYNAQSPKILDGTPPLKPPEPPNKTSVAPKFKKKDLPGRIRNRSRGKRVAKGTPGPLKRSKKKEEKKSDNAKSVYSDLSDASVDSYDWLKERSNKRKQTTKTYGKSSDVSSNKGNVSSSSKEKSICLSSSRGVPSRSAAKKALEAIKRSGAGECSQNPTYFADRIEQTCVTSPEVLRDTSYKTTLDYKLESAFSVGKFANDSSITSDHASENNMKLHIEPQLSGMEEIQQTQRELKEHLELADEGDVMNDDMSLNDECAGPLHSTPIHSRPRVTYVKEPGASTCQKPQEVLREQVSPCIADNLVPLDLEPRFKNSSTSGGSVNGVSSEMELSPKENVLQPIDKKVLSARGTLGSSQSARPKPRFRSIRKPHHREASQNKSKKRRNSSSASPSSKKYGDPNHLADQEASTPTGPRRRKLFQTHENPGTTDSIPRSILLMVQDQMSTMQKEIERLQWRSNMIFNVIKDCLK